MKIGIISDIHSNLEALESVLSFLSDKVEKIVHVGDLVGYGANPKEVIASIIKNKIEGVMGNHDNAVLFPENSINFNDYARQAVFWTRDKLSKEELYFLEGFPYKLKLYNFLLVHSTPSSPEKWRYLTFLEQAEEEFNYFNEKICFIGHTHAPAIIELDSEGEVHLLKKSKIKLEKESRYIINVGSVGQPRDGNPDASFVVYDIEKEELEFYRVDYDKNLAAEKIIQAGLPEFLGARLLVGR